MDGLYECLLCPPEVPAISGSWSFDFSVEANDTGLA
jgi:hypothetical protein